MKLKVNNINVDIANYVLPSHKLDFGTGKRMVLIADLHGYHNNPKKRDAIVEAIRMQNPHHIVIAGDHMNAASGRWHNEIVYANFCKLVKALSEIAPVVLSQGNHDINALGNMQEEVNRRFMALAELNPGRIFPLINDRIVIDGFEIIGFTPSHDVMSDTKTQLHGVAHDKFIKEYMEKGVRATGGDDVIVEYAGHNPHLIGASENGIGLEGLVPVDSFLAGHLHNGYIPSRKTRKNPDHYLDSKGWVERPFGLVDNEGKFIPSSIRPMFGETNLCRGVVYVDDLSQQRVLQLRNDHFYYNDSIIQNKQHWRPIHKEEAEKMILESKLHALVITGGVKKFSPIPRIDEPEITVVDYEGRRK